MTKTELIDFICKDQKHVTKKTCAEIIDTIFYIIQKNVKKDKKFAYPGFGTFMLRSRKARTGRDPRTGVEIAIKASKTVGFRPAKAFKDQL